MRFLHTMVRIGNVEQSLDFYCNKLGLKELRRREDQKGRYTLIFLAAPGQEGVAEVELTFNWDPEPYGEGRNFGHLAFEVDDIYALCEKLERAGVTINRPPRDGRMAFVRSPDHISVELLQKGAAQAPKEPWKSRPNVGKW
jgi:lactoylglutathione lyase